MSIVSRSCIVYSKIFANKHIAPCLFKLQSKVINYTNSRKPTFVNNLHTSNYFNGKFQFNLSDIGEGIREVVVKEWFVKVGDKVSQFDNICEVQSDKASVTITSRYDGIITKLYYAVDSTAIVGKPLVEIETEGEEAIVDGNQIEEEPQQHKVINNEVPKEVESFNNDILCIPSVRRLAKQYNLNLANVTGTGKKGRILKEDVLYYLNSKNIISAEKTVIDTKQVNDKIESFKGFQKAMFKSMTESLEIPHFVYSDEISVKNLTNLRKSIKQELEENDLKLSFMPIFIKAASNALEKYPILNSTLVKNEDKICFKGSHNIGIAMDTKNGLAVPVIKNVKNLSIVEIAKELNRLMISGKEGNFSATDITGATFTISNIGIIGGTYTKPVIMPPQVAIIAIGAAKVLPRFDEAKNVIADEIISISGAADHRVIDGATMAHFVNVFKKQIENPYLLFLNI